MPILFFSYLIFLVLCTYLYFVWTFSWVDISLPMGHSCYLSSLLRFGMDVSNHLPWGVQTLVWASLKGYDRIWILLLGYVNLNRKNCLKKNEHFSLIVWYITKLRKHCGLPEAILTYISSPQWICILSSMLLEIFG